MTNQQQINSRIISLVQEIRLSNIDPDIVKSLLESIRDDVTLQLKKLTVSTGALHHIDPTLVSAAVLKIPECIIPSSHPGQLEAIITGVSNSTSASLRHLHHLDLRHSQVAPDILAGAALKLETFNVTLSRLQVETILTMLAATEDSRLRQLEVSNYIDLSSLDPEVVAGALTKLVTVGPQLSVGLSPGQVSALLSRIHESPDLRLLQLHLCDQNICHVPLEVVVGAIQKLEKVVCRRVRMTDNQATAIFNFVKRVNIKSIKIIGVIG